MNEPGTPKKTWLACTDCEGHGSLVEFRHYAGEAVAGELYELPCETCGGTGGEFVRDCPECGETLEDDGSCGVGCEPQRAAAIIAVALIAGAVR